MTASKMYKSKAHQLLSTLQENNYLIEREMSYELNHITFLEKTLSNLQKAVTRLRIARNKTVMGFISSRGGLSDRSSVHLNKSLSPSGLFNSKARFLTQGDIQGKSKQSHAEKIRKLKKDKRLNNRRRLKTQGEESLQHSPGFYSNIGAEQFKSNIYLSNKKLDES